MAKMIVSEKVTITDIDGINGSIVTPPINCFAFHADTMTRSCLLR
jgi:hypothetical protein